MLFDHTADYSAGGSTEVLAQAVQDGEAFLDARPDGRGKAATLHVLRYHPVRRLLTEADLTTRRPDPDFTTLPPASRHVQTVLRSFTWKWPLLSEGPYHTLLRQHLNGTVRPLTTDIDARAQARVRATLRLRDDRFSWQAQVAEPVAVEVLAAILGVPYDVAGEVARHATAVADQFSTSRVDDRLAVRAIDGLRALERWLVEQLSVPHRTEFMRALGAIRDDPRLGVPAASASLAQAVTGAYDPIVSTLCVLATRFDPATAGQLSTTALAEEIIRIASPFRFAVRYNHGARQIGDVPVAPETRCVLGLATANLDPTTFPDPLAVRARNTTHLAFGFGTHYCLGAAAARAAVRGVLTVLREEGVAFVPEHVSHTPELGVLRFLELDGHWSRRRFA